MIHQDMQINNIDCIKGQSKFTTEIKHCFIRRVSNPTKRCFILKDTMDVPFPDFPDFQPNLSPAQVLAGGAFGGTYFRDIYSSVTNSWHTEGASELPQDILQHIPDVNTYLTSPVKHKQINRWKAVSGSPLELWESKGWIKEQDPRGWFQWYIRFYYGRRTPDDRRQVERWKGVAGEDGRWRKNLYTKLMSGKESPVVRQLLWNWALDTSDWPYQG